MAMLRWELVGRAAGRERMAELESSLCKGYLRQTRSTRAPRFPRTKIATVRKRSGAQACRLQQQ
ncbi:hypothetical protein B0T26DRAFT_692494 [Lasiosphaeria miniovina]|uniref:Uncharacterized protein n=1 Tax=Lasiosphaeria miniovina TaxID=1954250 RepID=A0AA40E957_9PEZI|nr:uncharacterized protein B0T26DRAFT_692494 [Lasiosphaeria miniovina]KAK0726963.1 hypothetical protein B0T26DRAFT_692494 [Lasiosphaeria miniovina]